MVVAQEIEQGLNWAESRIKSLTGGDKLAANFMRQDIFEFEPQFKLFIAGNHKPRLQRVDEAIQRRIQLIPFSVTIPKDERDHTLYEKLKDEWPGILSWIIEGAAEWQQHGLKQPTAVLESTAEYFRSEDFIAQWISETCAIDLGHSESFGRLYKSYCKFAEQNGERPDSQKSFSHELESRGFTKHRSSKERRFMGLNCIRT